MAATRSEAGPHVDHDDGIADGRAATLAAHRALVIGRTVIITAPAAAAAAATVSESEATAGLR